MPRGFGPHNLLIGKKPAGRPGEQGTDSFGNPIGQTGLGRLRRYVHAKVEFGHGGSGSCLRGPCLDEGAGARPRFDQVETPRLIQCPRDCGKINAELTRDLALRWQRIAGAEQPSGNVSRQGVDNTLMLVFCSGSDAWFPKGHAPTHCMDDIHTIIAMDGR